MICAVYLKGVSHVIMYDLCDLYTFPRGDM